MDAVSVIAYCVAGGWTAWTRTAFPGGVDGVDSDVVAPAVDLVESPTGYFLNGFLDGVDANIVTAGADVEADGVGVEGVDAYSVPGGVDGVESDVVAATVELADSPTGKFRSAVDGVDADGMDADRVARVEEEIESGVVAASVGGRGSGDVASRPQRWQSQQQWNWKGRRDRYPVMVNDHSVVVAHCM